MSVTADVPFPTRTELEVKELVPVPPLPTVSVSVISANVKVLNVGAAEEPVDGPAKTVLAV